MSKTARTKFIDAVKKKYLDGDSDVCMSELLSFVKPNINMTAEDAFLAYCELMHWSDGDAFLRTNEDQDFVEDITGGNIHKYSDIFK